MRLSSTYLRPKVILAALFIVISLGIFNRYSFYKIFFEASILLGLIYSLIFFFKSLFLSGLIDKGNLILLIITGSLIFVGAYSAWLGYSQPIFYGIAAQREFFLIGLGFILANALKKNRLTIEELNSAFLLLVIINFSFALILKVFFVPMSDEVSNFVIDVGGGKLDYIIIPTFIVFGALYHWVNFSLNKSKFSGLCFLAMIMYIALVDGGMMLTFATIVSIFIFEFKSRNSAAFFFSIIRATLFGIFIFFILFLTDQNLVQSRFAEIAETFAFLFMGATGGDNFSLIAREDQFLLATSILSDQYFLGTGVLSNQWNGGYGQMLGYFHVSDLGVFGVIFQYGLIISTITSFLIIGLVNSVSNNCGFKHQSLIYQSIWLYLIFLIISSLSTGAIIFRFHQIAFFLILLLQMKSMTKLSPRGNN